MVQRNFNYATKDVRVCYDIIKGLLYRPEFSKVVFILHSQGGIEGGLVLDWLLQELPQDMLSKLEVYTFGNAANHFNNPHRHAVSQTLAHTKGLEAMNTVFTETTYATPSSSPVEVRNGRLDGETNGKNPPPLRKETSSSMSRSSVAATDRAIGHVEHYAHSTDFVAIWGVLHFATNHTKSQQIPRFLGTLFVRADGGGGHQFNQHYLDGMFPLERNAAGKLIGCRDSNEFMESVVEHEKGGTELQDLREGVDNSWAMIGGRHASDIKPEVGVHGSFHSGKFVDGQVRVADLSRLWLYRLVPRGSVPLSTPLHLLQCWW